MSKLGTGQPAASAACSMQKTLVIPPEKIAPVPTQEWSVLRDFYLQNWPKHIFSYYMLANYVQWAQKDAAMCERDLRITSDDNWRDHGAHILEDNNGLCNTIVLNTLSPQHNDLLFNMLTSLQLDSFCTLLYREHLSDVVTQFMHKLGITDYTKGFCPTVLYQLPKEKCMEMELNDIEGFVVKPLSLQYAKHINAVWSHRYPGSDYCLERVIRHNMTAGAFDVEHGNLCAWILHSEQGTLAVLQVEEAYRRRGLAEHLVRYMCRKLGEQGLDALATVMDSNVASSTLFQKLGFQPIDRVYWLDIVGMNKENFSTNALRKLRNSV